MLESTKILKSMRAKQGYDICDMAKILPFHRETYRRYENNPLKVDSNILFDIVEVLNGDLDELFYALKQDYLSCKKNLEKQE